MLQNRFKRVVSAFMITALLSVNIMTDSTIAHAAYKTDLSAASLDYIGEEQQGQMLTTDQNANNPLDLGSNSKELLESSNEDSSSDKSDESNSESSSDANDGDNSDNLGENNNNVPSDESNDVTTDDPTVNPEDSSIADSEENAENLPEEADVDAEDEIKDEIEEEIGEEIEVEEISEPIVYVENKNELIAALESTSLETLILTADLFIGYDDLNITDQNFVLEGNGYTINSSGNINILSSNITLNEVSFKMGNPTSNYDSLTGIYVTDSIVYINGAINLANTIYTDNFVLINSKLISESYAEINSMNADQPAIKLMQNSSVEAPGHLSIYAKNMAIYVYGEPSRVNSGDIARISGNLYINYGRTAIYTYDTAMTAGKMNKSIQFNIDDGTKIDFVCSNNNVTDTKVFYLVSYDTSIGNNCSFTSVGSTTGIYAMYSATYGDNFNFKFTGKSTGMGIYSSKARFGDNTTITIDGYVSKGISISAVNNIYESRPKFKNVATGENFTLNMNIKRTPTFKSNLFGIQVLQDSEFRIGKNSNIYMTIETDDTVPDYSESVIFSGEGLLLIDENSKFIAKGGFFTSRDNKNFIVYANSDVIIDLARRITVRNRTSSEIAPIRLLYPRSFDIRLKDNAYSAGTVSVITEKGFAVWTENRYLSDSATNIPWDIAHNEIIPGREFLIDPLSTEDYFEETGAIVQKPLKDFYRIAPYSAVDVQYIDVLGSSIENGAFDKKVYAFQNDLLLTGDESKLGTAPDGYLLLDPDRSYTVADVTEPIEIPIIKEGNIVVHLRYLYGGSSIEEKTFIYEKADVISFDDLTAPEGYAIMVHSDWKEEITTSTTIDIPVEPIVPKYTYTALFVDHDSETLIGQEVFLNLEKGSVITDEMFSVPSGYKLSNDSYRYAVNEDVVETIYVDMVYYTLKVLMKDFQKDFIVYTQEFYQPVNTIVTAGDLDIPDGYTLEDMNWSHMIVGDHLSTLTLLSSDDSEVVDPDEGDSTIEKPDVDDGSEENNSGVENPDEGDGSEGNNSGVETPDTGDGSENNSGNKDPDEGLENTNKPESGNTSDNSNSGNSDNSNNNQGNQNNAGNNNSENKNPDNNFEQPAIPEELPSFIIKDEDSGDYIIIDDNDVPLGNVELRPGADPMEKESWVIIGEEDVPLSDGNHSFLDESEDDLFDNSLDDVPKTGDRSAVGQIILLEIALIILLVLVIKKKALS